MFYYHIVLLYAGTTDPDFRGFVIQARTMADGSAVGTFTVGNGVTDQRTACTDNVSDSELCLGSYKIS